MKRMCLERGCGNAATVRGRCQLHATRYNRDHPQVGRQVYASKRWQMTRRHKLAQDPLCARCGQVATDVHHVHGVVADPWSLDGLESLCHSCHGRETALERAG